MTWRLNFLPFTPLYIMQAMLVMTTVLMAPRGPLTTSAHLPLRSSWKGTRCHQIRLVRKNVPGMTSARE